MAGDEERMGRKEASADDLTRRDLLGMGVTGGAGLVASAYPLARYLSPVGGSVTRDRVELPEDQLGLWEAAPILLRGSPGFVVRTPTRVYACSGVCTHLGCIVRWNRSRRLYFCPCHGARFAPDGRVLGGPAPAPLPRFDVKTVHGKIVVEIA
jgi:cytochrome b6-f complex iron-sulfur subunit